MQCNCSHGVLVFFAVLSCLAPFAAADLEKVEVGGNIVILGEFYRNAGAPEASPKWPGLWLVGRPVGNGRDIFHLFGGGNSSMITQWTRLHVNADFSRNVGVFLELDSVDVWGDDFRSDYLGGGDSRAGSMGDVEIYQAYAEAGELFGAPLRIRAGRQELRLGGEWLVGGNDNGSAPAWGLSFDALRLTYETERLTLDAWAAKASEPAGNGNDGHVDFYGVYASLPVADSLTLDGYWLWVRDGTPLHDTTLYTVGEWIEDLAGVDNYGTTSLHTVGMRLAGETGPMDFELETAYQFGGAGRAGSLYRPVLYGDHDAEFNAWGFTGELGYTFEADWSPRVYAGYAFFQGDDNRDGGFWGWLESLANPFYAPSPSLSFNRLFSNRSYSAVLDGSEMTNVHSFHVGAGATPAEKIEIGIDIGYHLCDEPFNSPVVPLLAFWTKENDTEIGWEVDANLTYNHSEDLYFCVGWDHLFVGNGLKEGSFTASHGHDFNSGITDSGVDYWYFETGISF